MQIVIATKLNTESFPSVTFSNVKNLILQLKPAKETDD